MNGKQFSRWGRAAPWVTALLTGCTAQSPTATPLDRPLAVRVDSDCGVRALRESVLREVNIARAKGMSCGARHMPQAKPLAWDGALAAAAAMHSSDMARRDYFAHAGPEGGRVGNRVTAAGYRWRSVGENIAGGDRSVEIVVRGWLDSPGHCANIMNPEFNDIGVACVERTGTTWGTYWTMVLGRRR